MKKIKLPICITFLKNYSILIQDYHFIQGIIKENELFFITSILLSKSKLSFIKYIIIIKYIEVQ